MSEVILNARLEAQASVSHRKMRFQWDRIPVAESLLLLLLVKEPDKPDQASKCPLSFTPALMWSQL